ncbi:MAG: polyphosphate kinase 2 family protein [Thermoleophilia bacterium]|nr:polyphosphate kinase 2 family protein [Thermoleophilia bacterium]
MPRHALRDGLRVEAGKRPHLGRTDPRDTLGLSGKDEAADVVARCSERLEALQSLLASEDRRSLLLVLQGMDASGKDGVARALCGAMNPMILRMAAFGVPTKPELRHDFLWRIARELPERGRVGLFNRSHYEDVLVVRVDGLVPEETWRPRYGQIARFEERLAETGTTVVKVMLHISRDEQLERLRERAQDPLKRWKFSADDLRKRDRWDAYMAAYEDAIEATGTEDAPWYVVPADRKWARNALVLEILTHVLEGMDLPEPPPPEGLPPGFLPGT